MIEQLEKRLFEIQKEKLLTIGRANLLSGQELELTLVIQELKKEYMDKQPGQGPISMEVK